MADSPSAPVTQWLAGGLTVVSGAAAVFGASNGSLGRVVRDHPQYAKVWLGVALLAVAVGVIAPAVTGLPDSFIVAGAFFLLLSVWALGVKMTDDQSLSQRPQVSADVATSAAEIVVTGKIVANGLKSSSYMQLQVDKYTTRTKKTVNLYTAFVGPDGDGHVDAPVKVAAARGRFDRIIVSGQIVGKVDEKKADQPRVALCDAGLPYRGCAVAVVPRKESRTR